MMPVCWPGPSRFLFFFLCRLYVVELCKGYVDHADPTFQIGEAGHRLSVEANFSQIPSRRER